jgi:uncharacterized membrane protein YraQ (UPF0718 family)
MDDKQFFVLFLGIFFLFYFAPKNMIDSAVIGGLEMLQDYARHHVLTCLVPAFFIAGAITVLLKKEVVLKYLGAKTNKLISYTVASLSGSILAVCSCTVLPLFAGIWKRGAGLGPAITFLYSGPAINIAAIFLTATVLGFQIGIARAIGAIVLSIVIGLFMGFLFRNEKNEGEKGELVHEKEKTLNLSLASIFIFVQILFLIVNGLQIDFQLKLFAFASIIIAVAYMAIFKLTRQQAKEWLAETWSLSKSLLPVLFVGVFIAGVMGAMLPNELVVEYLGGNSIWSNLFASVVGALMYFATLTEVPIIQTLMAKGMGAGPSLALLLAGPSLSLPSVLVIDKILGHKKTLTYVALVVIFSTIAGLIYGNLIVAQL